MEIDQKFKEYNIFLANVFISVAKVSIAIYLIKQTPKNCCPQMFVKFLQNQFKKREQDKESLINIFQLYLKNKNTENAVDYIVEPNIQMLNCNTFNQYNCIQSTNYNEESSNVCFILLFELFFSVNHQYFINMKFQLNIIHFNFDSLSSLTITDAQYQLFYVIKQILKLSTNQIKKTKINIKSSFSLEQINYKNIVNSITRKWFQQFSKYFTENNDLHLKCLLEFEKIIIKNIDKQQNNISTSISLSLIKILEKHVSTNLYSCHYKNFKQILKLFINETIKLVQINEQTCLLNSNTGKNLFIQTSNLGTNLWLTINLLPNTKCNIFDTNESKLWFEALDTILSNYKMQTKLSTTYQLSGFYYLVFLLRNKIKDLTKV